MAYPLDFDTLPTDRDNDTLQTTVHPNDHNVLHTAMMAVQQELGLTPSGGFASVAARLAATGVANVKEFGAVGDGTTDDRAAIQSAIDLTSAFGGGTVFFPAGDYRVNCTSQGIHLPIGKNVILYGHGAPFNLGGAPGAKATVRLRRSAGTNPLVATDPAWAGSAGPSNKCGMIGLEIDGGGLPATVAYLPGLGKALFERVRFTNQYGTGITTPGVNLIRPWDVRFSNCDFDVMGINETSAPAVALNPVLAADGGTSIDTVNTVQFSNCYWWSNRGTDLRIHGEGANKAAHVSFVGCKWEFSGVDTRVGPNISLGRILNIAFSGCHVFMQGDAPYSCVHLDNTDSPGAATFAGCSFGGADATPLIDQDGGWLSCTGCYFFNWQSGSLAWDIASTVDGGKAQGGGNIYYTTTQTNNTSNAPTNKRYRDLRTSPTGPQSTP